MSGYDDYQNWPQESTSNTDDDELSSPEIEQDDSDDDSESSTSSSSSSATSTSTSSQSGSDSESTSTADENETISLKTEVVLANNTELCLPAGMCEDEEVFKQLFSVNSWVCLSDQQKQNLKNFLPKFPENDLMEKEITLRMLFGGQNFRFGVNPIDDFHDKLKNGHFRPDIVKMKSLLRQSLKREYRKNQRSYTFNMLKKLLHGRKKVIDGLNGFTTTSIMNNGCSTSFTMQQQVRRRYFRELSDIKHLVKDDSEDSSDSNYQEGPPARLSKKQRRNLNNVQNSLVPELETVTSTLAAYPDGIDLSKVALPMSNPFDPTEEMYKEMLVSHKRKQKKIEQEREQIRYGNIKESTKSKVSLGNEKKRSAVSDRPRVKRTKTMKKQTTPLQPPTHLDTKPPTVQLDKLHNIKIKQEPIESETTSVPYIKEEILQNKPSPPPTVLPPSPPVQSSPPSMPIPDLIEDELIKTNLNAIKLENCSPINNDLVKMKEEIIQERTIKLEPPLSLTADEIRKAEEGQAAAAMLLEQMSDIEEKYNPPYTPSPPPSSSPPPNMSDSKFSPPDYLNKREFHPEDMLTSTVVQSINIESPPRMLHSLTLSNYSSKQLSLSPVSTPSKGITDSNYVGSLSELEGFHVLDIKNECNDEIDSKLSPVLKKVAASFFALIRDIICSTWEYRMNMTALLERVQDWVKSISKNQNNPDWYYSLALKTWHQALQSAIGFLAGHFPEWQPEDFVPFIEYKPSLDTYQWIGAGRDSDNRLGELCNCWLHNLNNISSKLKKNIKEEVISSNVSSPIPPATDIITKTEISETDSSISLPTALLDTWIVTTSNAEERIDFQTQERQRFFKPHRSFTYRMHGYESIVGPVRGIYNSSNIHKAARGHSLLIESRPHYISILVLVRDATARLPNGMGTRSDICTLLKDSQYLMEANQTELHNAVSGALDRLHYEHDPCVKYDPKRKIWIYLHKGRTMEEFERLHLEQQGAVKMKCWRRSKTQKKWSPEAKQTPNRKLTSNVLLESLSMLDIPTSSTSDSMPSSSTSPVLSDTNTRTNQEMIPYMENLKLSCVMKTSECVKNRKFPIHTVQTTDNAVEIKIECPTMDQNSSDSSKLFAMPVSNNISTITTNNSPSITVSNITSQSIASIVSSQSIVSNVTSPSIASQSFTCKMTNQPIVCKITSQSMVSSNMLSQSIANTSLKVVNTQTIANSGQMNKISQSTNNSQQLTLVNSNKMVVNSISTNKHIISSGDLITIGPPRKKAKHIHITQPVTIGQSSVTSSFQHDHHLTITKSPQNKEPQRPILVIKQKRTDRNISSCEQTGATIVNHKDTMKPQTVQQFFQLQQQQKLQKQQMQLLQRNQIQQQNKQQVIIRKSDIDDKTEKGDGDHPQVIFVKQSPARSVQTDAQPITQQHLQQFLMMRPQQQTGQPTQVVMVKQPGNDQKSIAIKPILTSIRGTTNIQQSTTKTANLLLQTKQAGQNMQRRITKPIVGKIVSSQRTQLPVDTVLGSRKLSGVPQGTSLRISGVQTSKSGQPQYTVVTVAQPKLMPSNQLNIGQQTSTRLAALNDRLKSGDPNQPQTLRVVQSQIGGKPVLVTNKAQISTSITGMSTSSNIVSSSAVVTSTANTTYTVLQQGSQQILVPASSLKSIQGLKVIPLSQHSAKGRSQMFARIVNSDGVRPVFIHQPPNQEASQGSSESNS